MDSFWNAENNNVWYSHYEREWPLHTFFTTHYLICRFIGENIVKNFIIYTIHQTLLEWVNEGGWMRWLEHLWKLRNAYKTVVRKPEEKITWNSQVSIERQY
jgi:hypothetical protein